MNLIEENHQDFALQMHAILYQKILHELQFQDKFQEHDLHYDFELQNTIEKQNTKQLQITLIRLLALPLLVLF